MGANKPVVLVTRPAGQGQVLCAALASAGYSCQSLPLLQLSGLDELPDAASRSLVELDQYQHIIFISTNAVGFGMPHLAATAAGLPGGVQWHAIGTATAARLEEYGLAVSAGSGAMTTESLLAQPALADIAGQRVLIVKGCGGRVSLREGLEARGARVDDFECYRRVRPAMAPGSLSKYLTEWQIGLILISSGEGLANMVALLGDSLAPAIATVALIVPSARVLAQAEEIGFQQVQQAENASDQAMLDAVDAWWQARK